MRDLIIGMTGSGQYKHIMPVLEQYGYKCIDLQMIWENQSGGRNVSWGDMIGNIRRKISECDLIYNIYSGSDFWGIASYAKYIGKKVITHWIGDDATDAIKGDVEYIGHESIDYHFSCYEYIRDELQQIGINSTILPIVPFNFRLELCKMPDEHAVLIYLPETQLEHYGYPEACELFECFSNLRFLIVANNNKKLFSKYNNVEVLGKLNQEEMESVYEEITTLVRYVKHDGLSMMVIEALAKGKNVIWNFPYNGVSYVKNNKQVIEEINKIISRPPRRRDDISKATVSALSKDRFIRIFDDAVNKIYREGLYI